MSTPKFYKGQKVTLSKGFYRGPKVWIVDAYYFDGHNGRYTLVRKWWIFDIDYAFSVTEDSMEAL